MSVFSESSPKILPSQPEPGQKLVPSTDLMDVLALLWAGKWTIAFSVLVCSTLALGSALFLVKPVFQAETTLIFEPDPDGPDAAGHALTSLSADISAINTQIELIRSPQMMRDLVVDMELAKDPEFNSTMKPLFSFMNTGAVVSDTLNATAENVARAFDVSNLRNSKVLVVTARSHEPEKSTALANALAALYVRKQIEGKQIEISRSVDWLAQRVAALEQELERQDAVVQTLNRPVFSSETEKLTRRIFETKSRLSTLEYRQASLNQQAELTADVTVHTAKFDDPLLQQLSVPALSGNQQAILAYEQRKAELLEILNDDLTEVGSQISTLTSMLTQLEAEYQTQSQIDADLRKIERDSRATELLHQTFLSRLKETALRRGVQTADSRIISRASAGEQVAPRTARLTALGGAIGTALGICLVMLQLYRQSAVPTAVQLETATDYPVLGHLPKAPIRSRRQLVEYLANTPTSPLAEASRNLRTSLLMGHKQMHQKVILVTSSVPDEGKTTTAIALAHNLAGLGRSVLLIEADIRRLSFRDYFGENPGGGLVTALASPASHKELIQRDIQIGADILMGEKSARSAADLFASPEFDVLLEELKDRYDHVVIDSPPVLVVPDARVIGQSADAILLIVAAAHTGRDQVQQALREFSSVNLSVTGLVMSDLGAKARALNSNSYGAHARYYVT